MAGNYEGEMDCSINFRSQNHWFSNLQHQLFVFEVQILYKQLTILLDQYIDLTQFCYIIMPTIIHQRLPKNKKQRQRQTYNQIERVSNYQTQRFALAQGYIVLPSQQQLFYHDGKCQHLVISNQFGKVSWIGNIDLSRLAAPLSQTVIIRDREIEVYVENKGKPSQGKQLNRLCLFTFSSPQPLDMYKLAQICKNNGTKIVKSECQRKTFTIAIPHFTRYTFGQGPPPPKKQIKERGRLAQTLVLSKRNQIMQQRRKMGSQILNRIPLTSMRLQEEYRQLEQRQAMPGQNNVGSIMDGFKNYVIDISKKIVQRQGLLYDLNISQNSKALAVENENRAQYSFLPYEGTVHNTAVLQNVLFSADGDVCELKNYQKYQKVLFMERNKPAGPLQQGFQNFLLLGEVLTTENIARLVCQQNQSFALKRLLSLYAILFAQELAFIFKTGSKYTPQLSSKYSLTKQLRKNAIKDWLAWVIRQQFQQHFTSNPIKNKVVSALLLRKPQLATDFLIVNNRWNQAMLLTQLQDSKFRQMSKQNFQGMQEQLQIAMSNQTSMLVFQQWLLCFGFSAWYFRGDNNKYFSQIINSNKIQNNKNIKFGLQLRLFQLYLFNQNPKVELELFYPVKPNREQLFGLWSISNYFNLSYLQRRYWLSCDKIYGETMYLNYQHQLQKRIVQLYNDNDQRLSLLLSMIQPSRRIKTKNQCVLLVQKLVSEGKVLEALRWCLNNDNSKEIQEKIYSLTCHPRILLNYRTSVREEVVELLSKKRGQFEELILLLTFQKSSQTGIHQLKTILKLYRGESRFSRILTPETRSMIKSKLSTCIGNWIYQQNHKIQLLKQEHTLFSELRALLKDYELFQNDDV